MREIRFRAWANGQYWYSCDKAYALKEYDGVLWLIEDEGFYSGGCTWYEKIGKAEQYTGLKDSKGVEIYEGDICSIPYNNLGTRTVSFEGGQFNIANVSSRRLTVIGNIHENPELLK